MFNIIRRKFSTPSFSHILVSEDAVALDADPYDAMQDIVDFTNAVMHSALFKIGEFPIEAYQLYCADFYVTQVDNGGHSLFLYNAGDPASRNEIIEMAKAGMALIGCRLYLQCLENLADWIAQNPGLATQQNGFTQTDDDLEELDGTFFEYDIKDYYKAIGTWLRGSSLTKVLSRDAVSVALQNTKTKNPMYEERYRVNAIAALDAGLTHATASRYRACVARARIGDRFFEIQDVLGGKPSQHPASQDPDFDFASDESQVWALATNTGDTLYGLTHDGGVFVCVKNPEGQLEPIIDTPLADVERLIATAERHKPARYAVELLRRHFPDEVPKFMNFVQAKQTPEDVDADSMHYGLTAESGKQFLFFVHPKGVTIANWPENRAVGKLSQKEVQKLRAEDHSQLP